MFIEGDASFAYPSVYFWLAIHRVGDGRLVAAALGDEMPAPEVLASRWSPLGIELLDGLCPEVWLGDCGSRQRLSFRVSVGEDEVVVGSGEAKVGGQGNRYAIEIEHAYHRPCYRPCGASATRRGPPSSMDPQEQRRRASARRRALRELRRVLGTQTVILSAYGTGPSGTPCLAACASSSTTSGVVVLCTR